MAARRVDKQRRPGGRSARVRAAVLQATLEELAANGHAALSFDGIARRAGVHKTTVYRRWGSLEDLLLEAMLERGSEQVPIPDTGSLRGDLLDYGKAIVAGTRAPEVQAVVRAVASMGDRGSRLAEASHRFWATRLDLAGEMVERAVSRGEISAKTDPGPVLEAIIAPIYFRLLLSGEETDDDFVHGLAELVATGAAASATGD
jgi:AcrR family transcriptional regulator